MCRPREEIGGVIIGAIPFERRTTMCGTPFTVRTRMFPDPALTAPCPGATRAPLTGAACPTGWPAADPASEPAGRAAGIAWGTAAGAACGAAAMPPLPCALKFPGTIRKKPAKTEQPRIRKLFMGHLGAPPMGRPLAFQTTLYIPRCAESAPGFKCHCQHFCSSTPLLLIPPPSASPIRSPCAITIPAVERAVKQPPASLPSQPVSVEFSPTAGSQASVAGSPPVEDACRYCPVCSQRLESRRCKLICPVCGYYMSCADYY